MGGAIVKVNDMLDKHPQKTNTLLTNKRLELYEEKEEEEEKEKVESTTFKTGVRKQNKIRCIAHARMCTELMT